MAGCCSVGLIGLRKSKGWFITAKDAWNEKDGGMGKNVMGCCGVCCLAPCVACFAWDMAGCMCMFALTGAPMCAEAATFGDNMCAPCGEFCAYEKVEMTCKEKVNCGLSAEE